MGTVCKILRHRALFVRKYTPHTGIHSSVYPAWLALVMCCVSPFRCHVLLLTGLRSCYSVRKGCLCPHHFTAACVVLHAADPLSAAPA